MMKLGKSFWQCLGATVFCALISTFVASASPDAPVAKRLLLPFKSGTSFKVVSVDHGGSVWDFAVPSGTSVTAVESGKVIRPSHPNSLKDSRNILIEHADHTVALYANIDAKVKEGDEVRALANIGVTLPSQLHFSVYESRDSLPGSTHEKTTSFTFRGIPGGVMRKDKSYSVPR
jgi:murein DD-endopeptidase MepM/ murein hydrolase activator NlpD